MRRIHLNKEASIELRTLLANVRSMGSQMNEHQYVEMLIREKWAEYDSDVQKAAEVWEGYA